MKSFRKTYGEAIYGSKGGIVIPIGDLTKVTRVRVLMLSGKVEGVRGGIVDKVVDYQGNVGILVCRLIMANTHGSSEFISFHWK